MAQAPRDENRITTLLGVSSSDGTTPVTVYADPVTHRLLVDLSSGSGTVTSVSVVTANGFAGSVANATTTPAITLSTTITGILQGNGTAISAITVGTGLNFAAGTLSAAAAGLTVGTSPIASGTDTRILYDNAGILGEYTLTGTGTVVAMQTSPQLTTPNIGVATGTSLDVSGVLESGANGGTGGQLTMLGSTSGSVALRVAAAAGTGTIFQLPADNGTNTYVLQTNGSGITSWVAPSSGAPGTPTNSIQYNNASAFGGSATLLFNGTNQITVGAEGTTFTIKGADATTTDVEGADISIVAGNGLGDITGGDISITGGVGGATDGTGGSVIITAGAAGATGNGGNAELAAGAPTEGNGGSVSLGGTDGAGTNRNGGDVFMQVGNKTGSGTAGKFIFSPLGGTVVTGILNFDGLTTSDKTFTFPDASGTIALSDNVATITVENEATDTTCFPLFVTAATGNLGPKSNTGLTFNSNTASLGATLMTATTSLTTASVLASSNDSGALGASGTAFSDLFLASGAVINFNAGNVTLTHSAGILTQNAGELRITSANVGTNADSVPTLSSTSTFTNKTLTSPVINTGSYGGAQTLTENAAIALDPALSADGKYTGVTITGTAGATLAFGDLIYLAVADSRWELADASAVSTGAQLTGFCVLAAAADGDPTTILLSGNIRADTAFPALTVGAPVYMSETAGDVTTTAPTTTDSVTRVLGWGLTADSMIVSISPDWITHT